MFIIYIDMVNNKNIYITTDENKLLNEKYIRWIKKINECLEVCTKSNGCAERETHKICKFNSLESYNKLNKYFE
jgi:hypothetical protein